VKEPLEQIREVQQASLEEGLSAHIAIQNLAHHL
jgi:hypothetical protein